MRKLVVDFDLIVLWPSIAFALIVFATSLHTYLSPSAGYSEVVKNGEDIGEWRRNQKRQVKDLLWFSAVALLILIAIMLMSNRSKLDVAYLTWEALQFLSIGALILASGMAWHYAEKQQRLKLLVCLLAMVIAAASVEHCFHEAVNTRHLVCPQCGSPDD
ncbi:MAG TPA: hypothetical protein VMF56_10440 [Acidobacteriaceae bacterium]|nr:hypothetical protein [Acidobacteriaceae bacterium]